MAKRIGRKPENSVRVSLRNLSSRRGTLAAMHAKTPSWGRVATGTAALFAIVLAFLAGRVKAGGDPTQAKVITTPTPATTTPALPEPQTVPGPVTTQQS